jgi:thymidylate synthase (FAD)
MKVVKQGFEILSPACSERGFKQEAKLIEKAGRTAYKSENKITEDSYDSFIRGLITRGHEAVIEFGSMTVKFITDRGISHEIVRHRVCSFVQESTRYCNYGAKKFGKEITVIEPSTFSSWTEQARDHWLSAMEADEIRYMTLLSQGLFPQQARSILPNSLKTEIIVRANFREWRHIFALRALSPAPHPDMRSLMLPLYKECRSLLPCVFDRGEPA